MVFQSFGFGEPSDNVHAPLSPRSRSWVQSGEYAREGPTSTGHLFVSKPALVAVTPNLLETVQTKRSPGTNPWVMVFRNPPRYQSEQHTGTDRNLQGVSKRNGDEYRRIVTVEDDGVATTEWAFWSCILFFMVHELAVRNYLV